MDSKDLKRILAGLSVAGLLAGGSLAGLSGCNASSG
ncbi:MAG: SbtA family thio(seleno)oxazole RiPP natural product precursor [Thermodesulfobacteriota bacterium]